MEGTTRCGGLIKKQRNALSAKSLRRCQSGLPAFPGVEDTMAGPMFAKTEVDRLSESMSHSPPIAIATAMTTVIGPVLAIRINRVIAPVPTQSFPGPSPPGGGERVADRPGEGATRVTSTSNVPEKTSVPSTPSLRQRAHSPLDFAPPPRDNMHSTSRPRGVPRTRVRGRTVSTG